MKGIIDEKRFSDLYKILKEAGHNHNKTSIIQYLKSHSSDIDLDFEGMSLTYSRKRAAFVNL